MGTVTHMTQLTHINLVSCRQNIVSPICLQQFLLYVYRVAIGQRSVMRSTDQCLAPKGRLSIMCSASGMKAFTMGMLPLPSVSGGQVNNTCSLCQVCLETR